MLLQQAEKMLLGFRSRDLQLLRQLPGAPLYARPVKR